MSVIKTHGCGHIIWKGLKNTLRDKLTLSELSVKYLIFLF